MTDISIEMQEQFARIDRIQAETDRLMEEARKYRAEQYKIAAEQHESLAEADKLRRIEEFGVSLTPISGSWHRPTMVPTTPRPLSTLL